MKKKEILDLFDISGKVALVIGAAGSCGSIAAKGLAAAGAKVMGVTGHSVDQLKQVVEEIRRDGGEASYTVGDISDEEAAKRVVKETVDTYGGIDILAVLSGIHIEGPIVDQTVENFQKVMDANVKGFWLICREAGKVMIKQGRGGQGDSSQFRQGRVRHAGLLCLYSVKSGSLPSCQNAWRRMGSSQD